MIGQMSMELGFTSCRCLSRRIERAMWQSRRQDVALFGRTRSGSWTYTSIQSPKRITHKWIFNSTETQQVLFPSFCDSLLSPTMSRFQSTIFPALPTLVWCFWRPTQPCPPTSLPCLTSSPSRGRSLVNPGLTHTSQKYFKIVWSNHSTPSYSMFNLSKTTKLSNGIHDVPAGINGLNPDHDWETVMINAISL